MGNAGRHERGELESERAWRETEASRSAGHDWADGNEVTSRLAGRSARHVQSWPQMTRPSTRTASLGVAYRQRMDDFTGGGTHKRSVPRQVEDGGGGQSGGAVLIYVLAGNEPLLFSAVCIGSIDGGVIHQRALPLGEPTRPHPAVGTLCDDWQYAAPHVFY